ncbi:MAG: nucleotidyltransferase family protein [Pseudomonadota bacterium]
MGWPVMIFAAGLGTRMKQLTKDRPKPMIEVGGTPLIDHALALAEGLPAEKVVINLHYKAEVLQAHLKDRHVTLVVETPDILDTGGGLRNALPELGTDPVFTLNSDAIWGGGNPLHQLAAAWDPDRMDGLLACVSKKNTVGYERPGSFIPDASGRITRGDGLVYGGAQIIKTDRLCEIAETTFSLNRLWDLLIAENRLYAVEYDGKWCDVGHPAGIPLAASVLAAQDV